MTAFLIGFLFAGCGVLIACLTICHRELGSQIKLNERQNLRLVEMALEVAALHRRLRAKGYRDYYDVKDGVN